MPEVQFDGLVGATHNYGGLSPGNVASTAHGFEPSNPRAAAHQGLAKMRFVSALGAPQAVLPPHDRPSLRVLHALGFSGADDEVLAAAARGDGLALRLASSASAMWTANAATVAPSCDTGDARVHITPANLQQMFHRAIETPTTTRVLRAIFADAGRFVVHDPLPGGGQFADEGAANHTRLATSFGEAHLFGWGRRHWGAGSGPALHPARQTYEASCAVARGLSLRPGRAVLAQQHPAGIDDGAFHTDVLAVGTGELFLYHERAFAEEEVVVRELRRLLGDELLLVRASEDELPTTRAVAAYPFNSQLLSLPDGSRVLIAPEDARDDAASRRFLERVTGPGRPVSGVHYLDVRQSMRNGGGPACLRLRVLLSDEEVGALSGRVLLDRDLDTALSAWVDRHYRDRLVPGDLADPELARESMRALDELTNVLGLGSVYDFQAV